MRRYGHYVLIIGVSLVVGGALGWATQEWFSRPVAVPTTPQRLTPVEVIEWPKGSDKMIVHACRESDLNPEAFELAFATATADELLKFLRHPECLAHLQRMAQSRLDFMLEQVSR